MGGADMGSGVQTVRVRVTAALKTLRRRLRKSTILTASEEDQLEHYLENWFGLDSEPSPEQLRAILFSTLHAVFETRSGRKRKWDQKRWATLVRDYFDMRRKEPDAKIGDKVAFHIMRTQAPWSERYGDVPETLIGYNLRIAFSRMQRGLLLPGLMKRSDVKERLHKWGRRGVKPNY
jgi:hypothetical protein